MLPDGSSAIEFPESFPMPPKYVAKTRVCPSGRNFAMKASEVIGAIAYAMSAAERAKTAFIWRETLVGDHVCPPSALRYPPTRRICGLKGFMTRGPLAPSGTFEEVHVSPPSWLLHKVPIGPLPPF